MNPTKSITVDASGNVTVPTSVTYSPSKLAQMLATSNTLISQYQTELTTIQANLTAEQANNTTIQGYITASNKNAPIP